MIRVYTGVRAMHSFEEAVIEALSLRTGILDTVETELDTERAFHEGTRPRALGVRPCEVSR